VTERYDELPPEEAETEVVERRGGPPPPEGPPPPWWREQWWIWLVVLLFLVALLIAIFALRDRDEEEEALAPGVVPSVVGLQEGQARDLLDREGFAAGVTREPADEPEGTVVAQDPEAGTELPQGSTVELLVSTGPPPEPEPEEPEEPEPEPEEPEPEPDEPEPQVVQVPDVVGANHVDAGATVDEIGLIGNTVAVQSNEERGTVVAMSPDPGTELREGSTVRLNVSLGPGEREAGQIPNVTGEDEAEARDVLRRAGFAVRTVDREAPEPHHRGVVILQQPAPGRAPVLTQVTIYVGR
jgi:eukaryotic-like serine/threonine-protein kinase